MPKRPSVALLSVWPGLAQVWSGQEVLGLILAALFAATVNLAIVSQWVWTEAFEAGWSRFFLALAGLTWLAALAYTLWWAWRHDPARHSAELDRLFREAFDLYLQGRFNESRRRLERILDRDEDDADALMQLGTIYLRTRHPGPARRAFRQCLECEGGAKWRREIDRHLARLDASDADPS